MDQKSRVILEEHLVAECMHTRYNHTCILVQVLIISVLTGWLKRGIKYSSHWSVPMKINQHSENKEHKKPTGMSTTLCNGCTSVEYETKGLYIFLVLGKETPLSIDHWCKMPQ